MGDSIHIDIVSILLNVTKEMFMLKGEAIDQSPRLDGCYKPSTLPCNGCEDQAGMSGIESNLELSQDTR